MKTARPLKLLLLAALIAAAHAHAQDANFVKIYGLMDGGILINDHSPTSRVIWPKPNGMNGARLGFTGREDLGGGTAAVFTLENGFDVESGAMAMGGRGFGSQTLVGLESRYGSLYTGRQINVDIWSTGLLAAQNQWSGLVGANPGDNDNLYNSFRIANAVKYVSPRTGGVQLQGLYAPGEFVGDNGRGRTAAGAISYDSGPLRLAASISNSRNPNIGIAANTGNVLLPVSATTNYFSSPIVSGYASARSWNVVGAGVNYTVGDATFGYVYSNSQYRDLGDTTSGPNPAGYFGTAEFQNNQVHVRYNVTPSWQVGAEYVITKRNSVGTAAAPQGTGSASYRLLALATRYYLSKSVFVYAAYGDMHASGTGSDNKPAVAQIYGAVASATPNQQNLRVGFQYRF